ncbi:MAG: hypothetical protein OEZ39_19600 [Gammaproteobacteria bacterium]|nr:hypothetical protein [Gammaproteobacteria bacterium]MDH5654072.1 hypothetical protein [Gammaproteobacteria bacterium]
MARSALSLHLLILFVSLAFWFGMLPGSPAGPQLTRVLTLPPPSHALMAFKDPVTGEFSPPTAEQRAELARQHNLRRAARANQVNQYRLQDGSKEIDLQYYYRSGGR